MIGGCGWMLPEDGGHWLPVRLPDLVGSLMFEWAKNFGLVAVGGVALAATVNITCVRRRIRVGFLAMPRSRSGCLGQHAVWTGLWGRLAREPVRTDAIACSSSPSSR